MLPAVRPLTLVVNPVPLCVDPPGVVITVHMPEEGSPLRSTEPVGVAQVGSVLLPVIGASGVGLMVDEKL